MSFYDYMRRVLLWGIVMMLSVSLAGLSPRVFFYAFDYGPPELAWIGLIIFGLGAWFACHALVEMIMLVYHMLKETKNPDP